MVAQGDVLNERYRLDRLLGRGGFARVFLATDLGPLGRQVAVKVLSAELAEESDFLGRFATEAGHVAALDHPNILPVYDYGEVSGTAFIVMPFVEGGTLQDMLGQHGTFGLTEAIGYLEQAAAALDYAHARGVVHRDVKPANMLVRPDGHLFLADFGIAKVLTGTKTITTRPVRTLAYMAPEQMDGEVSRASDIYALGCVVFELLTGEAPYTGTTQQIMRGHVLASVPSVVERSRGRVDPAVQPVLERALAKDPAARFTSAGEMVQALRAAADGRGITGATTQEIPTRPVSPPLPPTRPAGDARGQQQGLAAVGRSRWLLGGALAALLVLAVCATVAVASARGRTGSATATPVPVVSLGATVTATAAPAIVVPSAQPSPTTAIPPIATAVPPTTTVTATVAPSTTATLRPTVTAATAPIATATQRPSAAPTAVPTTPEVTTGKTLGTVDEFPVDCRAGKG